MRLGAVLRANLFILLFTIVACDSSARSLEVTSLPPETAVPPTPTARPTRAATPALTTTPARAITRLDEVKKATIRIESQGSFIDPQVGALALAGAGSGFIIDEAGLAITNNHVVTGAALLKVWVGDETNPRNASIVGVSECSDLAVIEVDGDDFAYLEWHNGPISTGLDVYAAGFPLGDPEFTLTRGIIAKAQAEGRTSWASVEAVIEHDAVINQGSSGGPLVTAAGQAVGVNYASIPGYQQYFAIARDEALKIIDRLRAGENVETIGVNGIAVSDGNSHSGVWVSSVKSGSPADQAGLKAGDIITHLEGLQLALDGTMADYCNVLRSHQPDAILSLEVMRLSTGERLEGQLNGRELSVVGTIYDEVEVVEETSYAIVVDDLDVLTLEAPEQWHDVRSWLWQEDDTVLGPAMVVSPDVDGYYESFATPGVFFAASRRLAHYTEAGILDEVVGNWHSENRRSANWRSDCIYEGRFEYEDAIYTGLYDYYTNCDGMDVIAFNLAVMPADRAYAALVLVQVAREEEAVLDHILGAFHAHGDLAAAVPLRAGDVVFSTEFDTLDHWSFFAIPDAGYVSQAQPGQLYLEATDANVTVYAVYDVNLNEPNLRLDAGVETVAGPNRNNISLVCRYNDDGWYEFSMNSGGYWWIWKHSEGEGYISLIEGASRAINLQRAKNVLTAVCQGDTLTFFVNGRRLGSTRDADFPTGGIGVSVTSFDIPGAGVEFDWLRVIFP